MNLESITLFIARHYAKGLADVEAGYPNVNYLVMDYEELAVLEPTFENEFKKNSLEVYTQLQRIVRSLLEDKIPFKLPEERIHVILEKLPAFTHYKIKDLSIKQVDHVLKVNALVSSITEIKHDVVIARWNCSKCDKKFSTLINDGVIRKPSCEECGQSSSVKFIEDESVVRDRQFGAAQELLENLHGTLNPPFIRFIISAPELNTLVPGANTVFSGVYKKRLVPVGFTGSAKSVYETYFEVFKIDQSNSDIENIVITPEEEQKIKELAASDDLEEKLIASFCPRVMGLTEVKFGILAQIFGGCADLKSKEDTRSEIHILIVGEPGQAKSTLLTYVNNLHPKSVYVSGKGASGVGITASVEKDPLTQTHILKAGAMVLASGGIMMLDEMDKMEQKDRSAMHTAMEQRKLHINKAGINAVLTTETSILAAANPKYGVFKSLDSSTISDEFNIPATLLSRFDLIFVIKDEVNKDKDRAIANFIGGRFVKERVEDEIKESIDKDFIRKYVSYAKKTVFPSISEEALELVTNFYVEMRAQGKGQNVITVTPRDAEGIIRIAQAIARMHLKPMVCEEEMKKAIALKMFALRQSSFNVQTGTIDQSILYVGISSSKADLIRTVKNIIKQMDTSGKGVTTKEIAEALTQAAIEIPVLPEFLERMYHFGDLLRPRAGKYSVIRGGE